MPTCRKCGKTKASKKFPPLYGRKKTTWCFDCMRQREVDYKATHGLSQSKAHNIRKRFQVLRHYSGGEPACACCGEGRYEFLSVDHITGGGRKHTAEIGRGKLYHWLVKNNFPAGFRVLCHNCNQSIGAYGYCPHQEPDKQMLEPPPLVYAAKQLKADQALIEAATQLAAKGEAVTAKSLAAITGCSYDGCLKRRLRLKKEGKWLSK